MSTKPRAHLLTWHPRGFNFFPVLQVDVTVEHESFSVEQTKFVFNNSAPKKSIEKVK
jgi:hypothetical protein